MIGFGLRLAKKKLSSFLGQLATLFEFRADSNVIGGIGSSVSSWQSNSITLEQSTVTNRPSHVAEFTAGHGVLFDGTNDFLSSSYSSAKTSGTIFLVFKTGTIGSKRTIISFSNSSASNEWLEFGITPEGRFYIEKNSAGTVSRLVGSTILESSTRYCASVSFDGSYYFLTINNREENPLTVESIGNYGWFGNVSGGNTLSFGACVSSSGSSNFFNGTIGLIKLYETDITHG